MTLSRAERLERLTRVQKRRREVEEWRLAELRRREADLAGEARDILESLGDQSLLNGLFLEAKASSLRRKEAERGETAKAAEAVQGALFTAARVERQLAGVAREARAHEDAANEARELSEIVDAHLNRRLASLE
jgi:hypothetical protein